MGLQKSIKGIGGVPLTYHRIASINSITNNYSLIEVCSYLNKDGRDTEKKYINGVLSGTMDVYTDTKFIEAPYNPDMTIEQAYEIVKNDFLEGSTDVLEEGNTAVAFALAVQDGMDITDVPSDIASEVEELSIAKMPRISQKEGYILNRMVVPNGYSIAYEFVEDPDYTSEEDGTYLKPYTFTAPMEVNEGDWYTDGEDIWECILSGVAESFTSPWFDVIE